MPRAQSRVEALWRTLIGDTFGHTHPSTLLAGHAFARWLHMERFHFFNELEDEMRGLNTATNDSVAPRTGQQLSPHQIAEDTTPDEAVSANDTSAGGASASNAAAVDPNRTAFYQVKYLIEVYTALADDEPDIWVSMNDLMTLIADARQRHGLAEDEWSVPYSETGVRFLPPSDALADPGVDWGEVSEEVVQNWVNQYQLLNYARRVFRTAENYLGNGPLSARVGDQVWILPGAAAPMILRPASDGDGVFTLVGQAYVHGVMHGEAVKRWAESKKGSNDAHTLQNIKLI